MIVYVLNVAVPTVKTVDVDGVERGAHFLASHVTCRLGLAPQRCGSMCRIGCSFVGGIHCLVSSIMENCSCTLRHCCSFLSIHGSSLH